MKELKATAQEAMEGSSSGAVWLICKTDHRSVSESGFMVFTNPGHLPLQPSHWLDAMCAEFQLIEISNHVPSWAPSSIPQQTSHIYIYLYIAGFNWPPVRK